MLLKLAILISGRGSNMEAILKAVKTQKIPVKPVVVISNKKDAVGLQTAARMGVATQVIPSKGFTGTREQYDTQIIQTLQKFGVTPKNGLVCLAGFMRIISPKFVKKYKNRILNIHPALLPAFPGLDSQKQAVDYGVKYSGCTVHIVDEGTDTGPIVIQAVVNVKDDDTPETLAKRILAKEHRIYPQAVELFARKKIEIIQHKKRGVLRVRTSKKVDGV